jgi:hypothetical protein
MGERGSWTGSASDLLRLCAESAREDAPPLAKNPRALAGRLRRAQTFLRMLDIEIEFGREGPGLSEWIGRTGRMRGIA